MESTTSETSTKGSSRRRPRILLGVTGSVAAVKAPEIAVRLLRDGCGGQPNLTSSSSPAAAATVSGNGDRPFAVDLRILLTRGGHNFWTKAEEYDPFHWKLLQTYLNKSTSQTEETKSIGDAPPDSTVPATEGRVEIHYAEDEWRDWKRLGDPVLHIELREWADLLLIAPLSAHTLAKVAHGLCDDTLSCVVRAWEFGSGQQQQRDDNSINNTITTATVRRPKPLLLAPAMNTAMWDHPITQQQLSTIRSFENHHNNSAMFGDSTRNRVVRFIPPQCKMLACGQYGNGAMAPVDVILEEVKQALTLP